MLPKELGELWRQAGLVDVEVDKLIVAAQYESFEDYWLPFTAGIAPSGAFCASLPRARREALKQACFRRLGRPAGRFELTARAWVVTGGID